MIDGLRMMQFPPVEPDVTSIVVRFGDLFEEEGGVHVELPIDRARTRSFEQTSTAASEPIDVGGLAVRLRGAAVGVLLGTVDIQVMSDEPNVVGASLGRRVPTFSGQARFGPLWRDWRPPGWGLATGSVNSDGETSAGSTGTSAVRHLRLSSTATAYASASSTPPAAAGSSAEPPTFGWRVRSVPGSEELVTEGGRLGGEVTSSWSEPWRLWFNPPLEGANGLEVMLDEFFIFRTGPSPIMAVPGPRRGHVVDLSAHVLRCGDEHIELSRWDPAEEDNTARLVLSPTVADRLPDLREVSDDSSVSLWWDVGLYGSIVRRPEGGIAATLVQNKYFSRDEVRLGVRVVGTRAEVPSQAISLVRV